MRDRFQTPLVWIQFFLIDFSHLLQQSQIIPTLVVVTRNHSSKFYFVSVHTFLWELKGCPAT